MKKSSINRKKHPRLRLRSPLPVEAWNRKRSGQNQGDSSHQTRFVFQRGRSDRNVTRVEPCDLRGQDATNLRVENLPGFGDRPAENNDLRVDRIDDRDQSPPEVTGRLPQ